ncbi:hypothetical protein HDV00_006897 [Rhizophlyctis rosea]|nr:hypothetical protein HDV00_006897 [Rhizophlyctis rosea]
MKRIHKSASVVGLWAASRVGLKGRKGKDRDDDGRSDSKVGFAVPRERSMQGLRNKSSRGRSQEADTTNRMSMVVKHNIAAPAAENNGDDVSASYRLVLAAAAESRDRSGSNASQVTVVHAPSGADHPIYLPMHKSLFLKALPPTYQASGELPRMKDAREHGGEGWKVLWKRGE